MRLGVVRIQTGSTNAKMAKSVVLADRPGYKTLAILLRQALTASDQVCRARWGPVPE